MAPKPIWSAYKCRSHLGFSLVSQFSDIEANGRQPYAFGHCSKLIIGWSVYQWSILVCEPCPRCGKS